MEKDFQKLSMENQRDSESQGSPASEGMASPIYNTNIGRQRHGLLFDPYASDSSNSPASLVTRRSSADPEATGSSSHAFSMPVVDEGVVIMDAVTVTRSNERGAGRRVSLPVSSYNSSTNSFGCPERFNSTLSPSGGSESRMSLPMSSHSSISPISFGRGAQFSSTHLPSTSGGGEKGMNLSMRSYDSATSSFGRAATFSSISSPSQGGSRGSACYYWENFGTCKKGGRCKFAHEVQDLNNLRGKTLDLEIWKRWFLEGSSSSFHGKEDSSLTPSKAAADPKAEGISLSQGSSSEYYEEFPPLTPSNAAKALPSPSVPTLNLPSPSLRFKVIAEPPNPTEIIAEPPNPTVTSLPPNSSATAPPPNLNVAAPPQNPRVAVPPPNPNVAAPPQNAGVAAPPPNPNVAAPPQNAGVAAPPPNPNVAAPPQNPRAVPPQNPPAAALPPNPDVIERRNYESWSPVDSGIQVSLPHAPDEMNPPREEVNAYIWGVLRGPSARERLPVFKQIRPDSPE